MKKLVVCSLTKLYNTKKEREQTDHSTLLLEDEKIYLEIVVISLKK